MTIRGLTRFAAALILTAAGCGHVTGNFPVAGGSPPVPDRLGDEVVSCEAAGVRFLVGGRIDTRFLRDRSLTVERPMAGAMGQPEFQAMKDQVARDHPWTIRIKEDPDHAWFRASALFMEDGGVAIDPGALVLSIVQEGDTIEVADAGILFVCHEKERESRFTGDGPVQIDGAFNGLGPGSDNRLFVRLPPGHPGSGRVIGVRADPARIRRPGPASGSSGVQ
ncbi:MAG: hypothetical protein AB7V45_02545 [Candidatus Krumholzibacteriia bacterium]